MTKYTKEEVYALAFEDAQKQLPIEAAEGDPGVALTLTYAQVAYAVGAVFGYERALEAEMPEPPPLTEGEVQKFAEWLGLAPETGEPEEG